jgi:hypothetical protein
LTTISPNQDRNVWPAGAVSLVAVAAGAYVTLALRPAAGAGGMFVECAVVFAA